LHICSGQGGSKLLGTSRVSPLERSNDRSGVGHLDWKAHREAQFSEHAVTSFAKQKLIAVGGAAEEVAHG
jgi:hypothetical protein